ncbi:MAG: VanZ family protein, partial [Balneolaceae bacterium]
RSGVSLVDRTHLFEYGIVSVLLFNAMLERNSSILKASIYAFLMTTLLGSIDEVIQYYLPVRVFDWLDIVRNISAGLIGIFVNSLFLLMRKKLSSSRIDSSS